METSIPVFTSKEGEAKTMLAYQVVLEHWPVLLILGEKEAIYNPQSAIRAAKKLIPGLQVAIIPEAHHITALAQPARVNQRILEFFAE